MKCLLLKSKKDFETILKELFMNIRNTGYNIYYIVNDKTSLQGVNILFNKELYLDKRTEHNQKINNINIQMSLTDGNEFFVLKVESLYFIFDIKRVTQTPYALRGVAELLTHEELFGNLQILLKKHFLESGAEIVKSVKDYLLLSQIPQKTC